MVLAHILAYIKFRYWYHWKYMKSVDFTGTKTKKNNEIEIFCDLERVVDILIVSLYTEFEACMYIDQQGKFRECFVPIGICYKVHLCLLSHFYFIVTWFKNLRWWCDLCEGRHFVNSLMSHYSVNANMVVYNDSLSMVSGVVVEFIVKMVKSNKETCLLH